MRQIYLVVLASILAGCSYAPSENTIQTAIAKTQTAQPTNTITPEPTDTSTPTPVPLENLDLEQIIFMTGDLPSQYKFSVLDEGLSKIAPFYLLTNFPKPDAITTLSIDNTTSGLFIPVPSQVVILLYNDLEERDDGYTALINYKWAGYPVKPLAKTGERAVYINYGLITGFEYVVFERCNALVYIGTDADTVNYAQRLDRRLAKLVCR